MTQVNMSRQGISVIVTTFNRVNALNSVLESLANQTLSADEIMVADDGSDDQTNECVKRWQDKGLNVIHCWQENQGFRAGRIRNIAAAKSNGEYLIFLDGDCLVFPDFIENHQRLSEQGWLVVGNRLLMSEALTDTTLAGESQPLTWEWKQWLRALKSKNINRVTPLLRLGTDSRLRTLRKNRWKGAHSCNLGIWSENFLEVNGFDEDYQGWGHEDADLVSRLFQAGVSRKEGHLAVPVLHLWHQIHPRDNEVKNRHRLHGMLEGQRPIYCVRGIQQHNSGHVEHSLLPLTVTIITKNAEHTLEKCLQSIQFADEIIVVDSGSVDRTEEISKAYGARFISQEWLGFGLQKKFAVKQANHQWVLSIDADEWVSETLKFQILHTLKEPKYDAYQFARCNRFMSRWLRHGEGYPDFKLRLFNKRSVEWSQDIVHEKLVTKQSVVTIQGDLMHESAKDGITDYIEKQNKYTILQAKTLFKEGMRPSVPRMLLSPFARFIKFYIIKGGFKDGLPGLVHTIIGCNNAFLKQAKLFEQSKDANRVKKSNQLKSKVDVS